MIKPSAELLKAGIEGFSINGKGNTVQIIGNSNMAVGHGIFTYLFNLGYRYYFANTDWHIVPPNVTLFKTMSQVSKPSFSLRRIWYGYGTGSKVADADYNFWMLANKGGGASMHHLDILMATSLPVISRLLLTILNGFILRLQKVVLQMMENLI